MANDHCQSDHQIRMLCLQKCMSNDIHERKDDASNITLNNAILGSNNEIEKKT